MKTTINKPKISNRRGLIRWINESLNLADSHSQYVGASVDTRYGGWAVVFRHFNGIGVKVVMIEDVPDEFIS